MKLRSEDVRAVRVLVDGDWLPGVLEAYRHDASGCWYGWVRWRRIAGENHLDWFAEEQLRPVEK